MDNVTFVMAVGGTVITTLTGVVGVLFNQKFQKLENEVHNLKQDVKAIPQVRHEIETNYISRFDDIKEYMGGKVEMLIVKMHEFEKSILAKIK